MSPLLIVLVLASVAIVVLALLVRRRARRVEFELFEEKSKARETGSAKARLQHPHVDLSLCMGCGACTRACPEDGVLELRHGQATVVHGARCVGHARCADACPVDAISITLDGLDKRRDIPALTHELEAVGKPGLFIAGELGGFALVRTAMSQGEAVGSEVALRVASKPRRRSAPVEARERVLVGASGPASVDPARETLERLDLLIVGAGPGGLACALAARAGDVDFAVIDQASELGGTVASYPRRKLVMTQPIELPLGVRLDRLTYEKEELVELWERVVDEHDLPIRTGVRLANLTHQADGSWRADTSAGTIVADHVCLALGRRGTPRKLGVPGEDLPKVAYSLIDAQSYTHRNLLVVGGGDSAVEAAIGLAEQEGNHVTLSYRKHAFFRLKSKNVAAIDAAVERGCVDLLFESEVACINEQDVLLTTKQGELRLPNDEVFVFAGGVAPFGLLEDAGVSFDPSDRPPVVPLVDQGTGLVRAAAGIAACTLGLVVWAWLFRGYYEADSTARLTHDSHRMLGPRGTVGLWAGLIACVLFVWNLLYLARRSPWIGRFVKGRLTAWLGIHVFTGLAGWLLIVVHCGVSASNTIGGHAFAALCVVVATGMIGRYLYSYVPRAANGAEATLEELQAQIAAISGEWDRAGSEFAAAVRERVERVVESDRWQRGFVRRLVGLVSSRRDLARARHDLRELGDRSDVPAQEVERLLQMAEQVHHLVFMASHFGDLRTILSSWRYLHRWLALLMLLLAAAHVVTSVRFGEIDWSVLWGGP